MIYDCLVTKRAGKSTIYKIVFRDKIGNKKVDNIAIGIILLTIQDVFKHFKPLRSK